MGSGDHKNRVSYLSCSFSQVTCCAPHSQWGALSSFPRRGRGFTLISHQSPLVALILYPFTVYKPLSCILSFYVSHSNPEIWKDRTITPVFRNKGSGQHRGNVS